VAIGLPEPFTSELQRWRERLGDPNAAGIPPHVTLLPPDLAARRRPRAGRGAPAPGRGRAGRSFEMHLRGTGTFRPVSPVVFVALARGIGDCERLERRSARPARAHAQLPLPPARPVAHDLDEPALDEAYEALASYDARFTVWGFTLFEQGPDQVWRPQRDFAFGRAACPARASRPRACLIIGG
jgi:2'-5' RNA ligase